MWNYSYDPIVLCMNKTRWDRLSPVHQEILRKVAAEAFDTQRRLVQEGEQELIAVLKQKGMTFSFLSEQALQPFRERVAEIYTEVAKDKVKG